MTVIERSHELRSVIDTTLKSEAVYSPTADSARYIGRKAAAVVSDAMRSGSLSSIAESIAACLADFPAPIWTIIDSDITMPLSTSIPSAIISAARDIWSSPMSNKPIIIRAISMADGIRQATISPVLRPSVRSMTSATTL